MSSLWRYFEKHENVAFCKHCDFKKNLTSTAPTTALFDHLKIKHPELNDEMLERNKLYLQEKVKEEWETEYMNAEEEEAEDGAIGMRVNAGNIPFGNARKSTTKNFVKNDNPMGTEMNSATPNRKSSSPEPSKKRATRRYWRRPVACKVCDKPSFYSYYGVRCCEGCKQFFRRIVVSKREYWCRRDAICPMKTAEPGERCLGCRLDRCLLAGMQPQMVNIVLADSDWLQFVKHLENRRSEISVYRDKYFPKEASDYPEKRENMEISNEKEAEEEGCWTEVVKEPLVPTIKDWQQLNLLTLFESRLKRNWEGTAQLPLGIERFGSMEELIKFPGQILPPPPKNARVQRKVKSEMGQKVSNGPAKATIYICVDVLMMLEFARALPWFAELQAQEQQFLLKHIHIPFAALCNAFYSSQLLNADTWTRRDGLNFMGAKLLNENIQLKSLSEKIFCKTVEAVQACQIGQEEFVLLLALLCSNSTAENLSPKSREQLYNRSLEVCHVLMAFLQQRHGHEAGARKYADCMNLLATMIYTKHHFEMFSISRRMSIQMNAAKQPVKIVQSGDFPRALAAFYPFS